jgi:SAM-dependent methyltransferase
MGAAKLYGSALGCFRGGRLMEQVRLRVPPRLRRGASKGDQALQIAQGVRLLALVRDLLGVPSLAEIDLLDVGCGTKVAQALINRNIPIRRYVGVDVYAEMIDFLRKAVADPRFSFQAVDFQNQMYNPAGQVMDAAGRWRNVRRDYRV